MASSESNESNSQLSSSIDKSISRKQFYEHEESVKIEQMASKKLSNSSDGKEQIEEMDEKELKHLLEEAMNFKNPSDAKDKSDTFKRLLQNVTDEDERKRKQESNSLNYWKQPQSNSLQNLLDETHYHLSSMHQSHTSSKKHSRRKNSTTYVSTRGSEGGSLPVDMHHSSAIQSPPDQPFLSELKNNKKRKEKQLQQQQQQQAKETVIDIIDSESDERKSYQRCLDSKDIPLSSSLSTSYHDAIEMKSFAGRNSDHFDVSGDSKFTTANSGVHTITTMASMMSNPIPTTINTSKSSMSTMTSVDSSIAFPLSDKCDKAISYQQAQTIETRSYPGSTINHSNNILLTGGHTQNYATGGKLTDQVFPLPAGTGVSSVMETKSSFSYATNKRQQSRDDVHGHGSMIQSTPQMSLNVNAPSSNVAGSNSKDSKAAKKRAAKSERNEKTIDVESIEGFRGHETVECLLSYIDGGKNTTNNNNNQKNHPKNGLLTSNSGNGGGSGNNNNNQAQLLNSEEKKKKMVAKNKEKVNKLKKSNSMDELCSTGRQQEQKSSSATATTANKTAQDTTSSVTLRSKSTNVSNNNTKSKTGDKDAKDIKIQQQQSKRNERRSWGTEGLWPESSEILTASASTSNNINNNNNNNFNLNNINNNNDEQQDKEETSSSDSSSGLVGRGVGIELNSSIDTNNLSHLESISSFANDAEKFQLVSKKRKFKTKSKEAPELKSSSLVGNNNNLYSTRGRVSGESVGSGRSGGGTKSTTHNDSNRNSAEKQNSKKPLMSHDAKQTTANAGNRSGKNRRKSTSSMPPSEEGEEGDYSDGGDSVQSLPIETTKTTSSLLSAPINNNKNNNANPPLPPPSSTFTSAEFKTASKKNPIVHQQFQPSPQQPIQQQLQKSTTISYADIAKTSNRHQSNNQGNQNIIATASTDKWPSISSSSPHQNNNNNNSTDPFAISNFDAMSNSNTININSNNNNNSVSNANINSSSSSSKQQPKVTTANSLVVSATSTNSISTSTMSFPELVESNNSKNKQLSNNVDNAAVTMNGDATQTELKCLSMNGVGDSGMIFMDTSGIAFGVDTDRINNNSCQKISYSQSLLENHHQYIDANGNAQFVNNATSVTSTSSSSSATTTGNSSKNILTKSKSVDHNNLSSIEHYPALEKTKQTLSEVLSKPIETLNAKQKQKQVKNAATTTIPNNVATIMTIVDDGKIVSGGGKKKEKLISKKNVSTSTSPQSTTAMSTQQYQQTTTQHNNISFGNHHRPAVIIMDDNNSSYENTNELGITFGFFADINEDLLCGNNHPNGDMVATTTSSSSSVVMADDIESSASSNANNNNNCDIMNTNLSSNNLSNNQPIEMYENYIVTSSNVPIIMNMPHYHQHQHQQPPPHQHPYNNTTTFMQASASSPETLTNSTMDSSHDLGYLSSSINSPPSVAAATAAVINNNNKVNQQSSIENENQPHERDFSLQVTPMEIRQHTKYEEFKMPPLPNFISPPDTKNFNFDELVAFVSEEWTKAKRSGNFFNDQ